jgi:lipopolysaccharide transport system ATP-binding protein
MSADAVITVNQVGKRYHVYENNRSRLLHALHSSRRTGVHEVWALRDVSFEVMRGESFAVIGRNGSGKSTLLEIITQTLTPTTGSVQIHGRVAALLELGSGFNPEYTGRENVFLNGLLLGLTRSEVANRFDDIAAFADIGNVLDRPVKTYSSGMLIRLAFAVQVALDPDILIVDEALSVGDFFFQQKCFKRLRQMRDKGLTLLFVSHDMGTVRDLCQRSLYLRNGAQIATGDTSTVIRKYFAEGADVIHKTVAPTAVAPSVSGGLPDFAGVAAWVVPEVSRKALFAVRILSSDGVDVASARMTDAVRVRVYFAGCGEVDDLRVGLVIKNRYDQIVTVQNSARLGAERVADPLAAYSVFEFEVCLMLEAGQYSMRVTLQRPLTSNKNEEIDSTPWFGPLQVTWDYERDPAPFLGLFGLPVTGRFCTQGEKGLRS